MIIFTYNYVSHLRKTGWRLDIVRKRDRFENISDKIHPFWRDILLDLQGLLPIKEEEEHLLLTSSGNSLSLILMLKEYVFIVEKCCIKWCLFIHNIVSEDNKSLSYQKFQNQYMYKLSGIV